MSSAAENKSLAVRLPKDVYRSSVELARRRRVSLNAHVQASLKQ